MKKMSVLRGAIQKNFLNPEDYEIASSDSGDSESDEDEPRSSKFKTLFGEKKKRGELSFKSVIEPEITAQETARPIMATPEKKITSMAQKMHETMGANETNDAMLRTIDGNMNFGGESEESIEHQF